MVFPRYFTARLEPGKTPYDDVQWELRTASIGNDKGAVIFEQRDVEVPVDWSQTATNIVVSKYFYGKIGSPERETSVRQLVGRVCDTIADWGADQRYFKTPEDAENFRDELTHLMLTQKACFNSPVWFNVGVKEPRGYGWYYDEATNAVQKLNQGESRPQCSACFINSVGDTLESILDLAKTEGMLFKWGSGTGTNLSTLREENGLLSSGGRASGPLSFMKGFDAFAGVIKSGGKTRRAAKMVILNADHPDIETFIWCKAKEEKKAHTLIDAGYDSSLDGDAYSSIFFQNANNSVRATDEFMEAVESDADWWTKSRANGQPVKRYKARDLMRQIAEATHQCGDPGMQFDTTVNRWHTSKNTARINASNPCSEYMFLDDSACNLASLNLMKFVGADGQFDVEAYRHAVDTIIMAQEIIVDNAAYPTEKIAKNSHDFRPLGLGYANLGALLMSMGIPYDSDQGRDWAAALTAIMCGQAYLTSARHLRRFHRSVRRLRRQRGAVPGRDPHASRRHPPDRQQARSPGALRKRPQVLGRSVRAGPRRRLPQRADHGDRAHRHHRLHDGLRHHRHRARSGAGEVQEAGRRRRDQDREQHRAERADQAGLHPGPGQRHRRSHRFHRHHRRRAASEGRAPAGLRLQLPPAERHPLHPLHGPRAHDGRGAAVHLRRDFEDHQHAGRVHGRRRHGRLHRELEARLEGGRDLSRQFQARAAAQLRNIEGREGGNWTRGRGAAVKIEEKIVYRPIRRKLPDERHAITHKFSIGGHEGYLTVGLYEDGSPGELFVTMAKEGSTISGLMDSFATAISYALQYGVPLKFFVDKFSHVRFEPSGWTGNPTVPYAKSIMDYIFRWLGAKFLGAEYAAGEAGETPELRVTEPDPQQALPFSPAVSDAPTCSECGGLMTRNGSCYKCENCGGTSGCS